MSKHTKGPWTLRFGRDGIPRGLHASEELEFRNIVNWNGFSSPTKKSSIANALLIASAPDLLKALEDILSHNLESDGATEGWVSLVAACAKARAAIAKAKGEQA